MTKAELYASVRQHFDMDVDTLPDSTLDIGVAVTEGHFNRKLLDHPRLQRRISWPLNAGDSIIPVPDRLLVLHAIKLGNKSYAQYPLSQEERASNRPPSFISLGNCYKIFPAASDRQTYTLDVTLAIDSLLDEQPGENWISKYFFDVYHRGLIYYVADLMQSPNTPNLYNQFMAVLDDLGVQGWNEDFTVGNPI